MVIQNHGLTRRADGVDQLRQAIREEVGRGCEIVKISVSDGHGSQPIPDYDYYSEEEIRAAADAAHSRNALIRAHCPSRSGIIAAARAGVDIIDHADLIDEEGIEAVLEADAAITPSYLWSERFLAFAESWNYDLGNFPIGNGFPESRARTIERLAAVRRDFDYTASMMPKLRAAGVRMLLGDDYGFAMMPHGDYASEMEVYVQHGVPPLEILRWATSNGADALRKRGKDLGRIEKGKLADLVVVAGDPTEDVSLFRNPDSIPLVLKDGVVEKDLLSHTLVAA
jgi:imidazolonepropionase-like amidohydrolase